MENLAWEKCYLLMRIGFFIIYSLFKIKSKSICLVFIKVCLFNLEFYEHFSKITRITTPMHVKNPKFRKLIIN